MAATTGLGQLSMASRARWMPGGAGGRSNSVMSAPAMKVRPVQISTAASTSSSAAMWAMASSSPRRTWWLKALTGGLSITATATEPSVSTRTDSENEVTATPG